MNYNKKSAAKGGDNTASAWDKFSGAIFAILIAFLAWLGLSHLPTWELTAVVILLAASVFISEKFDVHGGTAIGIAFVFAGLLVVILYYEPAVHEAIEAARDLNSAGTFVAHSEAVSDPRWDAAVGKSIHKLALYMPFIGALVGVFISYLEVMDAREKTKAKLH